MHEVRVYADDPPGLVLACNCGWHVSAEDGRTLLELAAQAQEHTHEMVRS